MRRTKLALAFGCLAAAGGCAGRDDEPAESVAPPQRPDWRSVATHADRARLGGWRTAFVQALAAARGRGFGAAIDREGPLLQPDAALDGAALPPGSYRCRVIKLGGKSAGMADFVAYPAFSCRVTATSGALAFEKVGGSQRPVGMVYSEDDRRSIFLGTMVLGDETTAMGYGRDPDRDMAGAIERVGPMRWRLLLPRPRFESTMDVVELVPAR